MSVVVTRPPRRISKPNPAADAHRSDTVTLLCMSVLLAALCALGWGVMVPPHGRSERTGLPVGRAGRSTYIVAQGDTVGAIAAGFGISEKALIRANHLKNADLIQAGQTLVIPGAREAVPAHLDGPPVVTRMIVAAARRFGVDPALALAVAWQESRLRQNRHSSAGAIGIMQVEPSTATMAMRQLGQRLSVWRTADNITAGVYWLSYLLRDYGGNPRLAVTAYYEGQGNLARYGFLPGAYAYDASVLARRSLLSGG